MDIQFSWTELNKIRNYFSLMHKIANTFFQLPLLGGHCVLKGNAIFTCFNILQRAGLA